MITAWTDQDRERIELYKLGWSVRLISIFRKEPEGDVRASVIMLLEILGEKERLD